MSSSRGSLLWMCGVLWLWLAPPAWGQESFGQEPIVVLTGPRATMTAGSEASFWLNVLNPSDREIAWTFPTNLACRLVSSQPEQEGQLHLRQPSEAGLAEVGPGAFVRREYLLTLPLTSTGPITVVLLQGEASPVVLQVQAATTGERAKEQRRQAALAEYIQNAAVDAPGHPYDPGRFFKEHISGHEPMYFIAGTESPTAKFQISLKYQLLNNHGKLASQAPLLKGFHLAYTQTSLWDLAGDSAPFFDSSYKPEFLYGWERIAGGEPDDRFRFDLQTGLQHESNGKDGADSRSLNTAYLRPTLTFGHDDGLQFTVQPRVWVYVGDLDDNPDLPDYRGYADLRLIVGWRRGLQLSALGRVGADTDYTSLQLDLTYPLMRLLANSFTVYLQAQYFTGYGESLLRYDERGQSFRIGLALFR